MRIVKMHGAGNDYVYVDLLGAAPPSPTGGMDWPEVSRRLSDRRFGVGGDGLIAIAPPTDAGRAAGADARMRIWNADGSEAEMCGNGIRCVAKYLRDRRLAGDRMRIETGAGILAVETEAGADGRVGRARVGMGRPVLLDEPRRLDAAGRAWDVTAVSVGNPHCVVFVEDVDSFPVDEIGPAIERHPAFPHRTNVEFVEVVSRGEVRQRTWERGSGETLACGTGATAVCVAGAAAGRTDRRLLVRLRGGDLEIEWRDVADGGEAFMTGPAVEVFEAEVDASRVILPDRLPDRHPGRRPGR